MNNPRMSMSFESLYKWCANSRMLVTFYRPGNLCSICIKFVVADRVWNHQGLPSCPLPSLPQYVEQSGKKNTWNSCWVLYHRHLYFFIVEWNDITENVKTILAHDKQEEEAFTSQFKWTWSKQAICWQLGDHLFPSQQHRTPGEEKNDHDRVHRLPWHE